MPIRASLLVLAALTAFGGSALAQTEPANRPVHREPAHRPERKPEPRKIPVVEPPRHPVKHEAAHAAAGHAPPAHTAARPAASAHTAAKPTAPAAAPPATPPAAAAAPAPAAPEEPPKGTVTGLPLPRWASLRADDVNLRAGPGTRYPIEWVYKRRDLPVEIEREFDVWRLVEDPDGVKGWVQQATLVGRRSFIVTGADRTLRDGPQDTASPVAILKPGVIGRLRSCAADAAWCEVQVGDYRGWLKRTDFWGTFPSEAVQ